MTINEFAFAVSLAANTTAVLAGIWGLYKLITSRRKQRPPELTIVVIVLAAGIIIIGPATVTLAGATPVSAAVGQLILLPALLGAAALDASNDSRRSSRPLASLIGRGVEIYRNLGQELNRQNSPDSFNLPYPWNLPDPLTGVVLDVDDSSIVIETGVGTIAVSRSDVLVMKIHHHMQMPYSSNRARQIEGLRADVVGAERAKAAEELFVRYVEERRRLVEELDRRLGEEERKRLIGPEEYEK